MSGGSPTFKSNPNPGKLNTSFWEKGNAFKKDDKPKDRSLPKKVSLYGKSFYDDKDADTSTQPQEKPKEVIYGGDDSANASGSGGDDDNKDGMIQIPGKCIQQSCKCEQYIENPSKWSKGKCKMCDHTTAKHKMKWVKASDVNANGDKSRSSSNAQSPSKPKATEAPKEPEPEPEPEELENLWGEEFTDKLKECVSNTFDYDEESILPAKYLLHYLKKRVGFDFTGQKQHRDALKFVSVDLFGWKVINTYGYSVKVLDS